MDFNLGSAQIFVPDGARIEEALTRTSHLGIGAHHDDLEIMAIDGILQCYEHSHLWFTGVVMTDGMGSPRDGKYKNYSDEDVRLARVEEQKKAAMLGEYGVQIFLEYSSAYVKNKDDNRSVDDLVRILQATTPDIVYTHNPTDKHDTHIGVLLKVINAVKQLPIDNRPGRLYGCEVWRGLDWILDEEKVIFDTTRNQKLQAALLKVFDSQISGGKRYDLAVMGRRRANATYLESHGVDSMKGAAFAMDLTPLITEPDQDIEVFVQEKIERFATDVRQRFQRSGI